MSLILDALRKSEAERQRAGAPRLHSPTLAAPPPPRAVLGPVLVTLVGVALLAATWWVGREVAPSAPSAPAPAPPVRVARVDPPAAIAVPAPEPRTVATPPAPPPGPPRDLARPPAEPVGQPRPLPVPAPASTAPIPLPDVPAPGIPEAALADPVAAPAAEAPLPGLATLPADERAALPPLKLSMHVWSAEPARRFAIVDGQRVTEGALLAGGRVAEIRRDGVVIELGDRRLLLPRP